MVRQYKAGTKLYSAVSDAQLIALRVPAEPLDIAIGGWPVLLQGETADESARLMDGQTEGTLVGKRYVDDGETMEFLCTKGGQGDISVNGAILQIKTPKALPSSD